MRKRPREISKQVQGMRRDGFDGIVEGGYKPTRDQAALTRLVDLEVIRARKLRSFRRLESAVSSLLEAIRHDRPIVSPS